MSHTLIVLPDDTAKPFVDAIAGARKSLNIRLFLFTDTTLKRAGLAPGKLVLHEAKHPPPYGEG